jgi:hypothetical protein
MVFEISKIIGVEYFFLQFRILQKQSKINYNFYYKKWNKIAGCIWFVLYSPFNNGIHVEC